MTKIFNIQKRPFSEKRIEDSFRAFDELSYELLLAEIGPQTKKLENFLKILFLGRFRSKYEIPLKSSFVDRFWSMRAHMKARRKLEKNLLFVF